MSTLELVLNMLAEATATELTKTETPQGLEENKKIAQEGGEIAGNARQSIEKRTEKTVLTQKNALDFTRLFNSIHDGKDQKI